MVRDAPSALLTMRDRSRLASLHRRLEARLRRAGAQRLLLAFVRRPGGEPDDVEGGADAAVGVGEALGVDLRHAQHGGAAGWRAAALDQNIGRAHAPEIA